MPSPIHFFLDSKSISAPSPSLTIIQPHRLFPKTTSPSELPAKEASFLNISVLFLKNNKFQFLYIDVYNLQSLNALHNYNTQAPFAAITYSVVAGHNTGITQLSSTEMSEVLLSAPIKRREIRPINFPVHEEVCPKFSPRPGWELNPTHWFKQ